MDNPTIGEAVDSAAGLFEKEGFAEARRNAQLLMMHLLRADMAELISRSKEELEVNLVTQFTGLVRRRLRHEPLQYITRRTEFWSHNFYVDPRAPIPRQETEHIVEEVLRDYPDRERKYNFVDIGIGSGVLAVVLAIEYPSSKVFATDVAHGSLEVAAINVSRMNASGRVKLLHGDLLQPLAGVLDPGKADVIVSNPPYISDGDASSLAPEVAIAEPSGALFAGPTGLEVYERLIPQAEHMLAPGGRLYLECGAGQAADVAKIVGGMKKLAHERTVKDLQGIERVVIGRKEQ